VIVKWTIVVLAVLVLALAGSTTYLGYDRIASDEDEEPEQQPASEVAGATPTGGPSIDLDLSRRCYEAWAHLNLEMSILLKALEAQDPNPAETLDAALGPDRQERSAEAMRLWQEACLSPSVVPVPNPASDINVLCVAARAEALQLGNMPAQEMSGVDARRLTVLETFVRSRCP
jgi:hypothetical protein